MVLINSASFYAFTNRVETIMFVTTLIWVFWFAAKME
jgi:hypothetical protein